MQTETETETAPKIAIEPFAGRVVVRFNGEIVADSRKSVVLSEGGLPPVHYVPVEDVRMELLEPTDRVTHCPHKGDAEYWSLTVGERTAENAVWSYPSPLPELSAIEERLAFYPDKVDEIAEEPAA